HSKSGQEKRQKRNKENAEGKSTHNTLASGSRPSPLPPRPKFLIPPQGDPPMKLQLLVVAGPDCDKIFPVQLGPELIIGRSPQAYYHLNDPQVARNQCILLREEDKVTVICNVDDNSTLVNGKPVKKQVLAIGDILQFGDTQIRFQEEE